VILWVIGAGGLFGSAVVRAAQARGWTLFEGSAIPWSCPDSTLGVITGDAQRFACELRPGQRWAIVWAAGRATTASTQEEADTELSVFAQCISVIQNQLGSHTGGTFLLASSAGGIYAGSANPPFDSRTPPHPTGVYGHLKRRQEIEAEQILADKVNVVIARIANLYGPGQDLSKLQGLISRLALTAITKQTLTMFVPLDTIRDYIHVDDAAHVALHWLNNSTAACQVRVIATGNSSCLGYIISQMKDITRTQVPVAYGMHPSAAVQAHDLRLIPDHIDQSASTPATPLPAGLKEVFDDVLYRHQEAATHAN
jgi:UDP-glucose 4-epimerase